MTGRGLSLAFAAALIPLAAEAQLFRPPPFVGGVPGQVQMQAIELQRHQARTLLYREALDEIRRNPAVTDIRECAEAADEDTACLPKPAVGGVPAALAGRPTARRIALLIGNHRYRYPIPPLETPPRDIARVADLLRDRLGFETRLVENADKETTIRAIAALAREASVADSVLIYYAGHGYLMDDTGMGYWIPVDGSVKTAARWLSNRDIARLLAAIPARQLMLVSDSCFSGTLASAARTGSDDVAPGGILSRRSVVVLASGGEEPVADEGKGGHSIFAWHLLHTLRGVNGTQAGVDVYRLVRRGVSDDYPQRPSYGVVAAAGHEPGGEYLFESLPQ